MLLKKLNCKIKIQNCDIVSHNYEIKKFKIWNSHNYGKDKILCDTLIFHIMLNLRNNLLIILH